MAQVISGSVVRLIPDNYSYKWFISNPHIFQHQKKLTSPLFVTGANNENTWRLEFYDTCELRICLQDCKEGTINALIQVHSPNEQTTMQKNYEQGIFNMVNYTKGSEKFLYDFPELRFLCYNYGWAKWPYDQLTIICEIKHEPKGSSVLTDGTLSSDLRLILKNGENSDAKVIVGRKEFPVHKFILAMRSPVFSAMFKQNMKNNQQNVIEVTDVDYDTMEKLLEYLYTGRVRKIDEMTDRLLIAGGKYALEGLKCMCSNILIEKISTENLCEMLKLAVENQADDLKAGVLDYILLHHEDNLPIISLLEILPDL